MKTHIFTLKDLAQAATYIKNGEIVAFPTETVYGLWANALQKDAVTKIYLAKWRPSDNPLIVHICEKKQLWELANIETSKEKLVHILIDTFWPGPLTLILPKKECISSQVSGGLDTVAIRMPNNPIALKLIELSGCHIAAPSANISGKPSGTKYEHVLQDFDGKIAGIIRSSPCKIGIESTVVDISWDIPVILRLGGLSYEELSTVIPELTIHQEWETQIVRSPWMKYKHYSPEAEVILFEKDAISKIQTYKKQLETQGRKVKIISPKKIENFWKKLFALLRKADWDNYDFILIEALEEVGEARAIMNRIRKSATKVIS